MAIITQHTQEQRDNIAARIGALFNLPDAGMKIRRDGWMMEGFGDRALLKVELETVITLAEAEAVLNARPLDQQ